MLFVKTESDCSVKSIRGKLYFYRGTVLQAANRYLADGVINHQGLVL